MHNYLPVAPGERRSADAVRAELSLLDSVPAVQRILNAMPAMAAVLNAQRQVVLANQKLVEFTGVEGPDGLAGLRLGEVLECVHSTETEQGCGTTPHCSVCGALRATLGAQMGRAQTRTCRMVRRSNAHEEPVELEISATPIEIAGRTFTVLCAANGTDRVRRERLEYGILPQALVLAAEVEALSATVMSAGTAPDARQRAMSLLAVALRKFTRVIRSHDELIAAETGRLVIRRESVSARELLLRAAGELSLGDGSEGRVIRIEPASEDAVIDTDPSIVQRVLQEMLLNALEATVSGGAITAGYSVAEEHVDFHVRNPEEMERDVQLQVFSRAFTTRAPGRGYGTYFMKLVAERHLGGAVWFQSGGGEGTTFTLRLPRRLENRGVAG
jgi:hypothetical protein